MRVSTYAFVLGKLTQINEKHNGMIHILSREGARGKEHKKIKREKEGDRDSIKNRGKSKVKEWNNEFCTPVGGEIIAILFYIIFVSLIIFYINII